MICPPCSADDVEYSAGAPIAGPRRLPSRMRAPSLRSFIGDAVGGPGEASVTKAGGLSSVHGGLDSQGRGFRAGGCRSRRLEGTAARSPRLTRRMR